MSPEQKPSRRWPIAAAATLLVIAGVAWLATQPMTTGTRIIEQRALLERLEGPDPPIVVDVRTPAEYAAGHVPGAVNIPYTELAGRLGELRSTGDADVVVYCEVGARAAIAEGILAAAGFDRLYHLQGDMRAWRQRSLPLE